MPVQDASTITDNAAVVRRGYEAFNTVDMNALTELFDESASWHTPGRSPLAGDQQGREATFTHFGRYVGETGGTFKAELQRVLTDSGRSHAPARARRVTLTATAERALDEYRTPAIAGVPSAGDRRRANGPNRTAFKPSRPLRELLAGRNVA